jgi:hypothetical protein
MTMKTYTTTISTSYINLKSLYLGADPMRDTSFQSGKVAVLIPSDPTFTLEGTLNKQGGLSGMAALFYKLQLKVGDKVQFTTQNAQGTQSITIVSPVPASVVPPTPKPTKTIFSKQNLRHIFIEPFRPENLNHWEPETETDVYMAFGVLQEYTDYQYCCGASQSLLDKLRAKYEVATKPDAILIDRVSGEYVMGEWKKKSSEFKQNHKPDDIDVLVCWIDDESDKSKLPTKVVALHSVARLAAETNIAE